MSVRRLSNQQSCAWFLAAALLLHALLSLHHHQPDIGAPGDTRGSACTLCLLQPLNGEADDIAPAVPFSVVLYPPSTSQSKLDLPSYCAAAYTTPQQPRAPPTCQAA